MAQSESLKYNDSFVRTPSFLQDLNLGAREPEFPGGPHEEPENEATT